MLRGRRRVAGPLGVLLGLALAFPLGVLAAIAFSDVPLGHPFYYDIQAVAEKGVTTGCGGGKYCPDDVVTRAQMAAFMNRLGALGADKTPVVNADKVDGYQAADLLKVGPITQQHFGPWTPNGNSPDIATATYSNAVAITAATAAGGYAQLPLVAPTSIGGVSYGLSSIQICTSDDSVNATITLTFVAEGFDSIIYDSTERAPGGCYTLTDPTPTIVGANQVLLIAVSFPDAGALYVNSTTTTWVPTSMSLEPASAKTTDTSTPR